MGMATSFLLSIVLLCILWRGARRVIHCGPHFLIQFVTAKCCCRLPVKAYDGTQTLQSIILLCTSTNKGGGYFTPCGVFLAIYIGSTLIWAFLNTFALEVIAFLDLISLYWQVMGGTVIVIMVPLVAKTTQLASFVFSHFEMESDSTGIDSKAYDVIWSFLVSQYSLYGYDSAAHLTEETKGADKNGPIAILSSIGIISMFGWAYILDLMFSIQTIFIMLQRLVLQIQLNSVQIIASNNMRYHLFHLSYDSSRESQNIIRAYPCRMTSRHDPLCAKHILYITMSVIL